MKQCHAESAPWGCLGRIQHLARGFLGYSCPWSFQAGPMLRWARDTTVGWLAAHSCRRKGLARGEGGHPRFESPPWRGFYLSPQVVVLSPTQRYQHTSSRVGMWRGRWHKLQGGHRVGTMAGQSQLKGTHHFMQRGASFPGAVVQELSG